MVARRPAYCVFFLTLGTLPAASEEGIASKYGRDSGNKVACGGELNENALTAAHKTLPCGTRVRVTNKSNGHTVTVTINDRGPFVQGRIIDLTAASARAIRMSGIAPVSLSTK
jgi:rare lipoprotein A